LFVMSASSMFVSGNGNDRKKSQKTGGQGRAGKESDGDGLHRGDRFSEVTGGKCRGRGK
jgi:hypothetical protein